MESRQDLNQLLPRKQGGVGTMQGGYIGFRVWGLGLGSKFLKGGYTGFYGGVVWGLLRGGY